jgi:hypothetical protein
VALSRNVVSPVIKIPLIYHWLWDLVISRGWKNVIILSKSWWDGEQAVSGSWKGSCLSFVLLPTIFWKLEKVLNELVHLAKENSG